jgi:hypothetical protein
MEAIDLICFKCKHFDRINGGCAAFGEDIPDEIVSGENEHRLPLLDQENDIVFTPIQSD